MSDYVDPVDYAANQVPVTSGGTRPDDFNTNIAGAIRALFDLITGVSQFSDSSPASAPHIKPGTGYDLTVTLPDAAGARKLIVKDSGAVEVAAIDSDGNITLSGNIDGVDLSAHAANANAHHNRLHILLDSADHSDVLTGTIVDGDVLVGNVTPKLARLPISIPAANIRNVFGVDNGELRPSWKTALDATNPANIAAAASPGTSLVFAHRDHVHAHPDLGDLHTGYVLADGSRVVTGDLKIYKTFAATDIRANVIVGEVGATGQNLWLSVASPTYSGVASWADRALLISGNLLQGITLAAGAGGVVFELGGTWGAAYKRFDFNTAGHAAAYGYFYPGTGAAIQSTYYLAQVGSGIGTKGYFYPGQAAATQTTRYLYDDATNLAVNTSFKVGTTLLVDTIAEVTAAAGVTIDGVLLKDSQVNTDQINEKTAAAGVTIDSVLLKDATILIGGVQVVGARVVDARCDDVINSGDATTDGVIDSLRDAMITHGLIAAA